MSEGTFENDGENVQGEEADGLATGAGPTESGDEQQQIQGDGTEQDSGNALDDVDLEPPSS
jgi:hypothetical protein